MQEKGKDAFISSLSLYSHVPLPCRELLAFASQKHMAGQILVIQQRKAIPASPVHNNQSLVSKKTNAQSLEILSSGA